MTLNRLVAAFLATCAAICGLGWWAMRRIDAIEYRIAEVAGDE